MATEGDVIRLPADALAPGMAYQVFYEGQWRNVSVQRNFVDQTIEITGNGRTLILTEEMVAQRDDTYFAGLLRDAVYGLYGVRHHRPHIDRNELGQAMADAIDQMARDALVGNDPRPHRTTLTQEEVAGALTMRDARIAHLEEQIMQLQMEAARLRQAMMEERATGTPAPPPAVAQHPGTPPPIGIPANMTLDDALMEEVNRRIAARPLADIFNFAGPTQEAFFRETVHPTVLHDLQDPTWVPPPEEDAQLLPPDREYPTLGFNFKCHWRPNE